ncbi:hypothetical protein HK096_000863 [Nowakowskiella sp. JEL0078]|nr:hypothetical protein HK096_000863 [Nowakowskiella sp. JEL0078]
MTPFPSNAADDMVVNFNFKHSSSRMVVERSFGMVKGRFRVLYRPQPASPTDAQNIFLCCVVLHNIANQQSEMYVDQWDISLTGEDQFREVQSCSASDEGGVEPSSAGMAARKRLVLAESLM